MRTITEELFWSLTSQGSLQVYRRPAVGGGQKWAVVVQGRDDFPRAVGEGRSLVEALEGAARNLKESP